MAPTERTTKCQKLSPTETPLPSHSTSTSPKGTSPTTNSRPDGTNVNEAPSRLSWYSGTWPRKAAPITQVARESISSASNTALETASVIKDKVISTGNIDNASRRSSLALTLGKRNSSKALPAGATTTIDHATPDGKQVSKQESAETQSNSDQNVTDASETPTSKSPETVKLAPVPEAVAQGQPEASADKDVDQTEVKQDIIAPRSWIGWLARADDGSVKSISSAPETQSKIVDSENAIKPTQEMVAEETKRAPEATVEPAVKSAEVAQSSKDPSAGSQRRSWLPIWNNAAAAQSAPTIPSPVKPSEPEPTPAGPLEPLASVAPSESPSGKDTTSAAEESNIVPDTQAGTKPSAWIFWSREKPAETTSLKDIPREGEIAIANTDTEQRPRRASISADAQPKTESTTSKTIVPTARVLEPKKKHGSRSSQDTIKSETKRNSKTTKVQSKGASATAIAPDVQAPRTASPTPSKKNYDHHLLPLFQETLKLPENPTLLQQLQRLFYSTKEPDLSHLNLIKDPQKVKNALVIGVHGYFPAPLIRTVLGQPTGTSIKFADMAAQSIQRWTKKRGYECQVKTAALEGEGKIAERIDLLWKLLLNWIDEIRKSDFIIVACHSQGVPVATMLVAKLIHFGCINAARVGICAMAGVNMGPFPEFKSRWISGSAGELFEFSDPTSKVSKDYLGALEDVLRFGVKITYVGSIDDQLVSLESSIFAPVSHPHLYRAVSIDSRLHAPNFVSHLVAFALKLRNLGVQDHGLIRELSAPLAGSLYSGEGHSRLYEDSAIYDLAVSFTLETSSLTGVPLSQKPVATSGVNPFILPFAMRGILEEDFVKSDLQGEASRLLQEFDEWNPTTKALKDVKFRLEGIRAKL